MYAKYHETFGCIVKYNCIYARIYKNSLSDFYYIILKINMKVCIDKKKMKETGKSNNNLFRRIVYKTVQDNKDAEKLYYLQI